MTLWIATPPVTQLLDALYADAAAIDPIAHQAARESGVLNAPGTDFYHRMRTAYMAVGPDFGRLLYNLVRATRAQTVVEFGTSFGISTIFLAAAIRDNGGGTVITTEFDAEKTARAKRNLTAAGLETFVEFRVGDARETLAEPPRNIDLIFLDGPKHLYLDVLRLLEPHLRSAGVVASDNTDHEAMQPFLDYLRDPLNGYTSSAILTGSNPGRGHEISVRH